MHGTTGSGSLPARPLRPGGRLPASAKVTLACLLWFLLSFGVTLWLGSHPEPGHPSIERRTSAQPAAAAPACAPGHTPAVGPDVGLAASLADEVVVRVLPLALPQARWNIGGLPPDNSAPVKRMDGASANPLPSGAGTLGESGVNGSSPADGRSAISGVRRITVTGPCAPLRFGVALLEAISHEAPRFQKTGAEPTVRWTARGDLELLFDGQLTHMVAFPDQEGQLADLAQPLPDGALVLVLDDMGQKREAAEDAVALPFPVTLAVWPRAPHAQEAAALAAANRLDCLVHQPMEALPRPNGHRPDPGPGVMQTNMGETELGAVLEENLRILPSAVGLNNHMGSAFTGNLGQCRVLCAMLRGRGLTVIDSATRPEPQLALAASEAGMTAVTRDVFLDTQRDEASVLKALDTAAARARTHGYALAIGHPHPETLSALRQWQDREGAAVVPLRRLIWKLAQEAAAKAAVSSLFTNTMDKE